MSKIKSAFEKGKAFIPFITCGDPDLETTEKILPHTDSTDSTEFLIQQNLLLCCFVENMYRD